MRHPAALALAGLLSLAVALGIGRFGYTPILPYMTVGLGISKSEAGLIASANFLGYLLGAIAAAWRAVPGDPSRWLLAALAVSGLSTGAMALTSSLGTFLVLRFANGAAAALVMVLASSLVMDRLAGAGRSGWAAVIYAGVGTGIAISALAVPAAATGSADWQNPWLLCGALSLSLAIVVGVLLWKSEKPAPAVAGLQEPGGAQRLRRLILAYGLFGFGYVITATFVSDMVRSDPDLQPIEHLVWLCVGLTAAPSVAFWGWAGRRWGNERVFAAACVIEAGGVALSVLGSGIWHLLLAAGLLGGTFMGLAAIGLVHVRSLTAGNPRRNLALMTAAFGMGQMVGPTLAGVLHDSLGSYLAASLLAAAALAAAAAFAVSWPSGTTTSPLRSPADLRPPARGAWWPVRSVSTPLSGAWPPGVAGIGLDGGRRSGFRAWIALDGGRRADAACGAGRGACGRRGQDRCGRGQPGAARAGGARRAASTCANSSCSG